MKSEEHQKIQEKAVNYLLDKSYWITKMEVPCRGIIADVWGMKSENGNFETAMIEVKVSKADFRNNKYKEARTEEDSMAERCYILCPSGLIEPKEIHPKWGLLWYGDERIKNMKQAEFVVMTDRQKLEVLVRFLASKLNKISP